MAVYWDLGAVCADQAAAETFAAWFKVRPIPLSDGTSVDIKTGISALSKRALSNQWIVWIWPEGMSYASPYGNRIDLVDTALKTEIEAWIYDRLQECPPYICALFGGEAYERLLDESLEELVEDPNDTPIGLVVDTATYQRLGQPKGFAPFALGYWRHSG
jgi:hypothetical protein